MGVTGEFLTHLQSGVTTVCRAWAIVRTDGQVFGFTDHDLGLGFDGITFRADTGLSAMSLQQSTGLSVDNTEALGALSDAAVTEADIERAGLTGPRCVRAGQLGGYCAAPVDVLWHDWRVASRGRGVSGRAARLTEALNRPLGRVYQKPCTAVLGDRDCGFDAATPGYFVELAVEQVEERSRFVFEYVNGFEPGWFERGVLLGLNGACEGLKGIVKRDVFEQGRRVIELWHPMRAEILRGARIRLVAGCDKRMQTCRLKFNNFVNYQGFPDVPGENWLMVQPSQSGVTSGGSRR